jgi:hypothetical protein
MSLMDIITLLVVASLVVLIIMNPSGFTQDVTSVGGYSLNQTSMFTGSNYNTKSYGKVA